MQGNYQGAKGFSRFALVVKMNSALNIMISFPILPTHPTINKFSLSYDIAFVLFALPYLLRPPNKEPSNFCIGYIILQNQSSFLMKKAFYSRCAFLFSAIACLLFFAQCKKEGANQHLDPGKQTANDYMSTKAGSWWLYGTADGTVYIRRATGIDTVKNGLPFSYYESTDTNTKFVTPEYFGKNVNYYVTLFDLDGGQTDYMTVVIMQDSAVAGTSWSNTETYKNNYDLLVESNVESAGGTLIVNGKSYNDVSQVFSHLKAKPKTLPTYIDCGTINVWFSKGVGLLKQDVNISVFGLYKLQHQDSLMDYHIEQ